MTQIPSPGNVTNVVGIPDDLRRINQWIVWKPVLRGKKLTKVPVSYAFPTGEPIDAQDQLYWCTFDEAVEVIQRDPRFGIGLVLRGTGILCIDYDDHEGDDKEAVARGAEYMAFLRSERPTYSEYSISGKGQHAFIRGVLPHNRITGEIDHLNWEVYAQQFIAITGLNTIGSAPFIADGQDIVDAWKLPAPVAGAGDIAATTALGRRLDYTDAEVISTMMVRRASIFSMMSSSSDLADRSTAFAQIIGDLDKITGDPNQVDRIIRKCPFMRNGYNAEKYDQQPKWLAKYKSANMLEYWLKQAREDNTDSIPYAEVLTPARIEFLKRVGDAIAYRTTVEAPEQLKQNLLSVAATPADVIHDVKADTPVARLMFVLEEQFGGTFDELTIPPGACGKFVDALAPMLTGPRLTYALPAVISTLSGYLGQTFKLPGYGLGLVNHFIIAGQMNTGKTSTMSVFNSAINDALSGWIRNPNKPTAKMPTGEIPPLHRRLIESRASSVQGLFDNLAHIGAATWFADEAESQIELMSSNTPLGISLKAFYKQTFDRSKADEITQLDLSRASAREGSPGIINMTLPSYWSCTSEVFQRLGEKELVDGTYSRVNMIYDEEPMSSSAEDEIGLYKGLPGHLAHLIQKMAFIADDTASAYDQPALAAKLKEAQNNKDGTVTKDTYRKLLETNKRAGMQKCVELVYSAEANDLRRKFASLCRQLGHDANPHIGKWPTHYQILARTDMLPLMVAGVLACCDALWHWDTAIPPSDSEWRTRMPQVVVSGAHMQWAFEFVMHWRLRLFKAWDQGKIAVTMSQDEVVMERLIQNALTHTQSIRNDGTIWIPYSYAVNLAVRVEPFKHADNAGRTTGRSGATEMARRTLDRMILDDKIVCAKGTDIGLSFVKKLISLRRDS